VTPRTFDEWLRFAHIAKAEAHVRLGLEREAVGASPPALSLAERIARSVRTIALGVGSTVDFEFRDEAGPLPEAWNEGLYSALLAAVRNCLDHGTGPVAGTPGVLRITLSIRRRGEFVEIELRDSGAGIDPGAVRAIVLEKGIQSQATLSRLPDEEVLQLLFVPGLSLKATPSRLSGRGLGLDIVRDSAERLGGSARQRSRLGEGTSLVIELREPRRFKPAA
jgi:two-component system chemotaxis sensor kinase CheA